MKRITHLIVRNKFSVTELPIDTTIQYLRDHTDIGVNYYLIVELSGVDGIVKKYGLNLSLLLLETDTGKSNTWEELISSLTESELESYSVRIPGYVLDNTKLKSLRIYYPMNMSNMEISYTSIDTPDRRNIKEFKELLPDLVITNHDKTKNRINFNNTLCSVNGQICYPIVFNDELFLTKGSRCLYSCHSFRQPDITLLDFSELGDLELVKFKDCTKRFMNRHNISDNSVDIEVTLPENIDTSDKSIFMVIGNTLYFPDQISFISDNTIYLKPAELNLHITLPMNKLGEADYLSDTNIVQTDMSISDYINNTIWEKDHNDSFFVIVNNNKFVIDKSRVRTDVDLQTFVSHSKSNGLLINMNTKKICSFVKHEYTDQEVLYINEPISFYRIEHDSTDISTGLEHFNCVHNRTMIDQATSQYELVFITN